MGGYMTYRRLRQRNGLSWRPAPANDPYPPAGICEQNKHIPNFYMVVGDWNRFEQDILGVGMQAPPWWKEHNPEFRTYLEKVAEKARVTTDQVQAVVRALMEVD